MRRQRGFSLVEIMVALTVFAVAALALVKASQNAVSQLLHTEQRFFAGLAAHNQMVELQLSERVDDTEGSRENGGYRFDWTLDVTETEVPGFLRLDLTVFSEDSEDALSRLSAFRRETTQ